MSASSFMVKKGLLKQTVKRSPTTRLGARQTKIDFAPKVTTAEIKQSYNESDADEKYNCSELKTKVELKTIELTDDVRAKLDDCKTKYSDLDEFSRRVSRDSSNKPTKLEQKYPFTLDTAMKYLSEKNPELLDKIINRKANNDDIKQAYDIIKQQKKRKLENMDKKINTSGNIDLNSFVLTAKQNKDEFNDNINFNIISELYFLTDNKQYYKNEIINDPERKNSFAFKIKNEINQKQQIDKFEPIYNYFKNHDLAKFINDNFIELSLDAMLNKLDIFENYKHFQYSKKTFNFISFYYTAESIYNLFWHLNNRQELPNDLINNLIMQLDNTKTQTDEIKQLNISDTTFILAKLTLKLVFINIRDKNNKESEFTQFNNLFNNKGNSPFEELCQLCQSKSFFKLPDNEYINYILPIFVGLYLIKLLSINDYYYLLINIIIQKYIPFEYINNFEQYYNKYINQINIYSDNHTKLKTKLQLQYINYNNDTIQHIILNTSVFFINI